MHPPFIFTDHRVGPQTYQPPVHKRRRTPERLDLRPMTANWPPVLLIAPTPQALPSGVVAAKPIFLTVVPPPRDTWRDHFGRFLIRVGQRMILQNRPG